LKKIPSAILKELWHDWDAREERLRAIVTERMHAQPPPVPADSIVASYFFALRSWSLEHAAKEISYHATSGTKDVPPGSLLEQCTGTMAGVDPWDATGRLGLLHIAFPLKMLLQPDRHLTSCDILHTVAGAIIFDVYETQDARLVALHIPDKVLRTFPGPAYGGPGVRALTKWDKIRVQTSTASSPVSAQSHSRLQIQPEPAFGTILKPTAGITPEQVGALVEEVAACPLFCFVKEDENLYPNLDYSPAAERTRQAVAAIERVKNQRDGRGIIFAPHITGAPHEIPDTVHAVLEAGATGVMFSETFAGGIVRMVREATWRLARPPAIYGHNAGIGVKTRSIFREVIDLLARLDGIDFRQTAPVRPSTPFLKPYGAEWEASEAVLTRPLPGIKPTMIVRAGALDQGNLALNLADVEQRGLSEHVLFLAGSAINSIKNRTGKPEPKLGAEAMQQALEVHHNGTLRDVPAKEHVNALKKLAESQHLRALHTALQQRYPESGH
jgi:ribulose 1,5-bisphosphate carboxylase large subunit-like protein